MTYEKAGVPISLPLKTRPGVKLGLG